MRCPKCSSEKVVKNGNTPRKSDGAVIQRYQCRGCGNAWNEGGERMRRNGHLQFRKK